MNKKQVIFSWNINANLHTRLVYFVSALVGSCAATVMLMLSMFGVLGSNYFLIQFKSLTQESTFGLGFFPFYFL